MKPQSNPVKDVLEMQHSMNALTQDKISETAPKEVEVAPQVEISLKEIARREGIPYIEPIRKFQAFGTLKPEWKAKRDHDWQYVKGMWENEIIKGEGIKFTFSKWPGDPDCMWEIPANKPVYVPRMIAKLLSGEKDEDTGYEVLKYHSFDHVQKSEQYWQKDEFTHQFCATGTYSRGRFRAIGAFS